MCMRAGLAAAIDERKVLWLLGSIQFVNILEFMMVMPLGPDFTVGLGASTSDVGYVAAAYTGAAAVSGFAGAFVLDRFDRRRALFVAMVGLVLGTFAGGLAPTFGALMAARMVAGAFGGPATSLALSILSDVIPPERRGRAMGILMGAFSVASVVGVPCALELARLGTWRAPFVVVGSLGLLVTFGSLSALPSMTGHLRARAKDVTAWQEFRGLVGELFAMASRPLVLASWASSFSLFVGSFVMIPNLAAYVQANLGFPREWLGGLYMMGGVVSFGVSRLVGLIVDRYGTTYANAFGVGLFLPVVWWGFHFATTWTSVPVVFVFFFVAMGFRNMSVNTQATRVPMASERARFQSVQSMVQSAAASIAAVLSATLLSTRADGLVEGMPQVLVVSTVFNLALTPLVFLVALGLRRRDVSDTGATSAGVVPAMVPDPP